MSESTRVPDGALRLFSVASTIVHLEVERFDGEVVAFDVIGPADHPAYNGDYWVDSVEVKPRGELTSLRVLDDEGEPVWTCLGRQVVASSDRLPMELSEGVTFGIGNAVVAWRTARQQLVDEGVRSKDMTRALFALYERYEQLTVEDRYDIDAELSRQVQSSETDRRFDALSLIREFAVTSAAPVLRSVLTTGALPDHERGRVLVAISELEAHVGRRPTDPPDQLPAEHGAVVFERLDGALEARVTDASAIAAQWEVVDGRYSGKMRRTRAGRERDRSRP